MAGTGERARRGSAEVDRAQELDLGRQLPEAVFADVEVVAKPEWQVVEKRIWEEALAVNAPGDAAMLSMQREARLVLSKFDQKSRVLAAARKPG
ncbi:hypothetical protein [Lentzea sp. E54]|uniref:hypothetical protein n=1 Tax=Lentzea xerophila TaxID=3435883 RepID=UPI003DA6940D